MFRVEVRGWLSWPPRPFVDGTEGEDSTVCPKSDDELPRRPRHPWP